MGTFNSDLMANTAASPAVMNEVANAGGRVRVAQGQVEVDASAEAQAGDILRLARLPVNAVIKSVKIGNDDLDSGTTSVMEVGIYDKDGNAKDADIFASASQQLRAAARLTELFDESAAGAAGAVGGVGNTGKRLWQLAGDAENPGGEYDICITHTAACDQDGTIAYQIEYTID